MYKTTIGIEIHVELKSKTKVYSDSLNIYDGSVNTYVNEIDLGYPGVLPKLNKEVINMALKAAKALNFKINKTMHFDRKNYFYPDLPKGYQITQNKTPIGYDGYVTINVDGNSKQIGIQRMHIEEDTCKSIHGREGTLLNFNRAGVPLIEIVSKPEISSEKEAVAYLETIREILLYLGISDVKIEEGSMRCDANVSISKTDQLGTKTEIKNIGSITNVATSIKYEVERQTALLEAGNDIIEETRRFDDKTGTTISMRVKETGNDYRYFPEPDLPFVHISDEWIDSIKLPPLPNDLRLKYRKFDVSENNIKTIINNYDLGMFLESIFEQVNPTIAINILAGDILSFLNKNNISINDTKLTNLEFVELVKKIDSKEISSKQVKDILPMLLVEDKNVEDIIKELGISQISDNTLLETIVSKIVNDNPESIKDYQEGKDRAIKYLMGQIMKETKGQANPQLVNEILIHELSKRI
jgi:aspartyl-tRNA(Asn)/glutamyl-tRNA(Gln) amidotransferase subunit B